MDKTKYVATVKDSRQYTEENWEPIIRSKEVTENTTLRELIDWQKTIWKNDPSIQNENIHQISISILES